MNNAIRVLGIDPGTRICGYGIIETKVNLSNRSNPELSSDGLRYIASGRLELSNQKLLHFRLKEIFVALTDIIIEHKPTEAVVEKVFFAKSARAALSLGQARGAAIVAATTENLPVYEYSALEVKKAVAGYGRAEKRQVQRMVRTILNLRTSLSPDSADALALAICHLNTMRLKTVMRNP